MHDQTKMDIVFVGLMLGAIFAPLAVEVFTYLLEKLCGF